MTTDTLAALVTAIQTAIDGWDGADWTHERVIDGEWIADDYGTPEYCEGGNPGTCERCREARESASTAGDLGREALRALRTDDGHTPDLAAALDLTEQAARIESQYGDDPTWAPAVKAIEAAIEERETPDPTEPAWVAHTRKYWAREGKDGEGRTGWNVPPACQGQIVEVSYAASMEDERVFRRVYDRSDRSEAVYVTESIGDAEYEPWNGEPSSADGEWYRIDVAS